MTRQELFDKYDVDEGHAEWNPTIDRWMSVEVYRVMHNGELPESGDKATNWITDFLERIHNDLPFMQEVMQREDWGSLYLTSKRMVYRFADQIIETNSP